MIEEEDDPIVFQIKGDDHNIIKIPKSIALKYDFFSHMMDMVDDDDDVGEGVRQVCGEHYNVMLLQILVDFHWGTLNICFKRSSDQGMLADDTVALNLKQLQTLEHMSDILGEKDRVLCDYCTTLVAESIKGHDPWSMAKKLGFDTEKIPPALIALYNWRGATPEVNKMFVE